MQRPRVLEADSQSALQSVQGLFRSTGTVQVLKGLGVIFQQGLAALFLATSGSNVRFPTIEQVQGAGSNLYAASKEANQVDLFISHSWTAGRWSKFLALCLFFNLELALKCCLATWFVVVSILITVFGWSGLGGNQLNFPALVCLPVASFFVVFFFGQELSAGCWSPSLWVDKLCVHQTDLELKAEQIASLPVFVAHSSRMLILWDETYFERLWCNLELATFARHGDANKLEVLPLWLAPWLLCSILLDLLSTTLFELLEHVFPNWSMAWVKNLIDMANAFPVGHNPVFATFVAMASIWIISGVVYLIVSIPSFFSFRMKLRNHQRLLDQMAAFDVRAAKCEMPSDRTAIEHQVTTLFEDSVSDLDGDHGEVCLQRCHFDAADPLDRFNGHVRGPLRALVISQIGDELKVPWHFAFIAFLPMILNSSVNVLGCDNGPCESSATNGGFTSVASYMMTQVVAWLLCILLTFPLTYPILLRMISFAISYGDGPLQLCIAFLCCPLAYVYTYICGGFIWGSLICLVQNYSATQLLFFLVVVAFLALQSFFLFFDVGSRQHPCRCQTHHEGMRTASLPLKRRLAGYDCTPWPVQALAPRDFFSV